MTASSIRAGHFAIGVVGLGLLRHWLEPAQSAARTEELRFLLDVVDDDELSPARVPIAYDVRDGYQRWAMTYDEEANPLIAVEQPVLCELLGAAVASGDGAVAVDVACGTGRVSALLAELGYEVRGVDATPAMLARAADKVPTASFRTGSLPTVPVDDSTSDLTTCALALGHVEDFAGAARKLARITKPGGRVVVTDLHPFAMLVGGSAAFPGAEGEFAYITSHVRLMGEQLAAFDAAGLDVLRCDEPLADPVASTFGPEALRPAFEAALVGLPFALLWSLVRR